MVRKWYTKLRNLVLIKKLNKIDSNKEKFDSRSILENPLTDVFNNKNDYILNKSLMIENTVTENKINVKVKTDNLQEDYYKLKEIRNKKRLPPKKLVIN